jgi:hypothetical protein
MKQAKPSNSILWGCCIAASLAFGVASELQAQEPIPRVTPEGLQLQEGTAARLVYLKPGATFEKYKRVIIVDSYVEFAENWQREHNRDAVGRSRVTTRDMDRMKADVAAEFKKVFTEELQTKGGYEVVDTPAQDVLVLRPAIIDLQVTAPDLLSANMTRTLVRSAGEMTLYLELWDSATNTILARIMDPQADDGVGRFATRASNKAAMDDILKAWAEKLRRHLDAARGNANGS